MATTSSNSSGSTTMAELMAKHQAPVSALKKGDIIKGKVAKLSRTEIKIDIGAKAEALVLEKERPQMNQLLAVLKLGDEVEVQVLNPESDMGYPVVSLRRFMSDRTWIELAQLQKDQATLDVTVTEATKGGYLVVTGKGTTGFLPNSHTSFMQNQQVMVGQKIQVSVLELNRKDNKVIFSQKSQVSNEQFAQIKKQLKRGDVKEATVANVTPFGVFVTIALSEKDMIDGLVHISEIAWEKVENIAGMFQQGQTIQVKIIGFDDDAKRLELSIKRLSEDPFDAIAKKYPVDTRVTGTIQKVTSTGLLIDLDGTEGIVRKEKLPPTATYTEGDTISLTVSDVDTRHRRILLVPVLLEKPIGYR